MSITHVETAVGAALPGVLNVPGTVAVDDTVILYGTVGSSDPATSGWVPLVPINKGFVIYYVTNSSGTRTAFRQDTWTGAWYRRWAAGAPTGVSQPNSGRLIPVFTVWRGGLGLRDVAVVSGTTPPRAPGAQAATADAVLIWFGYTQPPLGGTSITATTPATTSRAVASGRLYLGSDVAAQNGITPAYVGNATTSSYQSTVMVLCPAIAPLAPTLDAPAPSAVVDLADGGTFTWAHKRAGFAGSASGAQDAYALRRRVGVGAYEYWNASTASWSSTIVWNDSVDQAVTFPAGAWSNETTYAWSVATREDAGSNEGPFAPDRVLNARTKPTLTITAPDAVVSTPQPEITWDATYTSPWEAIAYEISVFEKATADTTGFDPETVPPVWTSGQYASTAETVTPSIPLANSTSYAVMVRVQQTGGQWSDWERVDVLVSLAAPASPHVDAAMTTDPDSGCPVVTVTVAARDNLLTAADASVEVPNSWEAGANTTITETTDWSTDGAQSLELTATAAGDVSISIPDPVTVQPGKQYTGTATVHAATTTRDVTVTILWEDADGTSLGSSPSLATEDTTDADGVTVQVTGTAPPNAAGARLQVTVAGCAATEVHHADQFGIAPGAATPWSPGGFTDVTATVEFSDDPLSGVWGTLATIDLTAEATLTDWTPQPGQLRAYRATTNAGTYSSAPSEVALAGIDVRSYWLVDVDEGAAIACRLHRDEDRTHPRDRGEFLAFGRPVSIMRYGDQRTARGAYVAICRTAADTDRLLELLNSGHTLLMQGPREDGVYPRHLYFAVVDDPSTARTTNPQGPYARRAVSWSWRADTPPTGEGYGGTFPAGYAGTL